MPGFSLFLRPPYTYLIIGVVFIGGALVSTCTGKSLSRTGGLVCRDKNPIEFWGTVSIYYLAGAIFLAAFLHLVHKHLV